MGMCISVNIIIIVNIDPCKTLKCKDIILSCVITL